MTLHLSPLLKIGTTNYFFQSVGKEPDDKDKLKRLCNGSVRTFLHSIKILGGIPSGPALLKTFSEHRASKILFLLIYQGDIFQLEIILSAS